MPGSPARSDRPRPAVSVVVPFGGSRADAELTAAALPQLDLGADDELIVADNSFDAVASDVLGSIAKVVPARRERSSYHARNAGAHAAGGDWLLFLDADCTPRPELLDAYFSPPPSERCGVIAGTIGEAAAQDRLLARYARSRKLYEGDTGVRGERDGGSAPTGNLLVRRAAFERLGGFTEGIRSGGDVELCWRLQGEGWTLERRPGAVVEHRHREDLRSFLAMLARYGASARWLNDRYPGASPRWPLSPWELGRSGVDAVRFAATGRGEEAAFRLVDALGLVAHNVGYRRSNDVEAVTLVDAQGMN